MKAVQWLESEDNRSKPTATLDEKGFLWFGRFLKSELSDKIKIGFYEKENEIKIPGFWVGHIIPPLRGRPAAIPKTPIFHDEQVWLIDAYKWIIDKVVARYAKSTPIYEHRATAQVALLEAISVSNPIYGTLKEQL